MCVKLEALSHTSEPNGCVLLNNLHTCVLQVNLLQKIHHRLLIKHHCFSNNFMALTKSDTKSY